MLLSNSKIDYSSVRRMPSVKFSGQNQGTTTNPMSASTSLQDISAHHQQNFSLNHYLHHQNAKDQQLIRLSKILLPLKSNRKLSGSHSDDHIFEHPEVTIKPSALDEEIQKRLLTLKNSSNNENLLEHDPETTIPNILEHPDMDAPVIMLTQQNSNSSSALLIGQDHRRVLRQQSADVYITMNRTPSPNSRIEFFLENNSTPRQSAATLPTMAKLLETIENKNDEENYLPIEHSNSTSTIESTNSSSNLNVQSTTTETQTVDPNMS